MTATCALTWSLVVRTAVEAPGLVGAHVLRHEAPALAETTEQKIRRGADRVAEHVLVVCGYELTALAQLMHSLDATLGDAGAAPGHVGGLYALSHSATPADVT